jgi:hypothetical protein
MPDERELHPTSAERPAVAQGAFREMGHPRPGPELEEVGIAGLQALLTQRDKVTISWDIIDGHIVLRAGCQRLVAHSYDEAMVALKRWADEMVKKYIEKTIACQLDKAKKP